MEEEGSDLVLKDTEERLYVGESIATNIIEDKFPNYANSKKVIM